jgi:acetyl-CoA synthetase
MTVESKKAVYEVAPRLASDNHPTPHYDTFEKYQTDHKLSVTNPEEFWTKVNLLPIQLLYTC